ncbi:four helix bundle protein [Mucilaginibacter jinjuensis]|uniref:Four helix bundle protein n=1 Tax=Mucilaginibacter jinjuensis TaxID=1176721 RepID=A0ABY7T537_9SPHI|nr:four helix bundle protein [Mucilaginibacter jinjuensis]WCT10812.1 four helix bundle protein [Mucilaginibacter jinjuensis]
MNKEELIKRTQAFAITIIKLVEKLPDTKTSRVLSNQLLRSATSVGANYRSACKGKSSADFINKIIIVEEEADESQYWLELIEQSGLMSPESIKVVKQEAKELTAIFTAIGKTAKENHKLNKIRN